MFLERRVIPLNKRNIQRVFDYQFNQDKMHQNIIDQIKIRQKKKRMIKYSFIPALFILVVSSFFITKNLFQNQNDYDVIEDKQDTITINEIDRGDSILDDVSNLDVQIIDSNHSTFDIMPIGAQVPSDLTLDTIALVYIKNQENGKYDILHDTVESFQGNDRGVNVSYSSLDEPMRDVDIPKGTSSNINGIEVMISRDDETFIVQFQYQNFYYDVESYNLTLDEVLVIVKSIIG